jgi:hypothetical protein
MVKTTFPAEPWTKDQTLATFKVEGAREYDTLDGQAIDAAILSPFSFRALHRRDTVPRVETP